MACFHEQAKQAKGGQASPNAFDEHRKAENWILQASICPSCGRVFVQVDSLILHERFQVTLQQRSVGIPSRLPRSYWQVTDSDMTDAMQRMSVRKPEAASSRFNSQDVAGTKSKAKKHGSPMNSLVQ